MKTKKITLILLTVLFTLLIYTCNSNKEYHVGDLVKVKGVIYEYVDLSNIEQYSSFSFEKKDEEQTIHSYYYYDMVNEEQKEIIPYEDFYKNSNLTENEIDEYYKSVSRASDVNFLWQDDQYLPMKYYSSQVISSAYQKGFVVKGHSGNTKHIEVVENIGQDRVVAIGYRAFKGNEMTRLTVNSRVMVLPEAISECPNLTYIDFKAGAALLSKAISQNPKLIEVTIINYLSDACFYDLPSLRVVDLQSWSRLTSEIAPTYEKIWIGGSGGIYKAPLYLCPNVRIFGEKTMTQKNVVYHRAASLETIVYVMDDYLIDIGKTVWFNGLQDRNTATMLPSFLNVGYDIDGVLSGGYEPYYVREDGLLFAANYSVNRMAKGEERPVVQIIQKRIA